MTDPALPPIPPTSPYEAYPDDRAAREARWPVLFGWISLAIGVGGFCLQGAGAAFAGLSQSIMKMAGMEISPPPDIVRLLGISQAVVLCGLGIVLIVGALMLVLRKPLGVVLIRAWIVARLIMVLVGLVGGILTIKPNVEWQITMTAEMRESMRKNHPEIKENQLPPIPEREAGEKKALWSIIGASLAFSVWPFAMAWVLSRPHVHADIASWQSPTGSADLAPLEQGGGE